MNKKTGLQSLIDFVSPFLAKKKIPELPKDLLINIRQPA